MIIELNTTFTQDEKDILMEYKDVDIKLFVDTGSLFYSSVRNGKAHNELFTETPNRMIGVGGLYLLDVNDELRTLYMGEKGKDSNYYFWGNYGNLKTALEGL